MSDCERFESTIQACVAGELDDEGLGPLLVHCRACNDCRGLLELHRDLVEIAQRATAPDQSAFDALHQRVLGQVDRRDGVRGRYVKQVPAKPPWYGSPASVFRVAAALAAAVLLFVAGLSMGRARPTGAAATANGNASVMSRLVSALDSEATSNRLLADVEDSRFIYSNVSFRPTDGDRVALDFDVTTHVQLVEPVQSEMVREVLVQSLLNPSSTGSRLKAISYAARTMEPKVREALIFAVRRDESLAVRLKALTILSDQLGEPEVEAAVLATLRDDDSVQVRLVALDYLAAHSVDRTRIREAIEETRRPGDEALMVHLADYDERL